MEIYCHRSTSSWLRQIRICHCHHKIIRRPHIISNTQRRKKQRSLLNFMIIANRLIPPPRLIHLRHHRWTLASSTSSPSLMPLPQCKRGCPHVMCKIMISGVQKFRPRYLPQCVHFRNSALFIWENIYIWSFSASVAFGGLGHMTDFQGLPVFGPWTSLWATSERGSVSQKVVAFANFWEDSKTRGFRRRNRKIGNLYGDFVIIKRLLLQCRY
jgi:hypothetical protein